VDATVGILDQLRRALRNADEAAGAAGRSELRKLGTAERFGAPREAVLASAPTLPEVRTQTGVRGRI
jgi:hypothetical protein